MRDRDRPRSAAPLHHVCRAHPRCAGYGSRRRGGRGPGTPVWWRQLVVVGDRWTRHTQCGLRLRRWPGTAQRRHGVRSRHDWYAAGSVYVVAGPGRACPRALRRPATSIPAGGRPMIRRTRHDHDR
jgi:hypothetical protein